MESECGAGEREPSPSSADAEMDLARSRQTRLIGRARDLLLQAVPYVADALAEKAKAGSVAHIRLLLQVLGLLGGALAEDEELVKEKTLEEILMEKWNNEP